jgi:hypothetical protein
VTAFLLVRSITDSRSNRVFCVHACGRLLAIGPPASTARLRTCALSPTRSQAVPRGGGDGCDRPQRRGFLTAVVGRTGVAAPRLMRSCRRGNRFCTASGDVVAGRRAIASVG